MKDLVVLFGVSFGIALRARHRRGVDRSDIEVVGVCLKGRWGRIIEESLSCFDTVVSARVSIILQ